MMTDQRSPLPYPYRFPSYQYFCQTRDVFDFEMDLDVMLETATPMLADCHDFLIYADGGKLLFPRRSVDVSARPRVSDWVRERHGDATRRSYTDFLGGFSVDLTDIFRDFSTNSAVVFADSATDTAADFTVGLAVSAAAANSDVDFTTDFTVDLAAASASSTVGHTDHSIVDHTGAGAVCTDAVVDYTDRFAIGHTDKATVGYIDNSTDTAVGHTDEVITVRTDGSVIGYTDTGVDCTDAAVDFTLDSAMGLAPAAMVTGLVESE